jgi:copper oxidase (laccase) domain-containing protein
MPVAVLLLARREQPEKEFLPQSFHSTAKSFYFYNINPYADDHPGLRKQIRTFEQVSAVSWLTIRLKTSQFHIIEDNSGRWNQSKGDALCTRAENVALALQIADCVPVLIADPVHNAVAAVHSGWNRWTLRECARRMALIWVFAHAAIPPNSFPIALKDRPPAG